MEAQDIGLGVGSGRLSTATLYTFVWRCLLELQKYKQRSLKTSVPDPVSMVLLGRLCTENASRDATKTSYLMQAIGTALYPSCSLQTRQISTPSSLSCGPPQLFGLLLLNFNLRPSFADILVTGSSLLHVVSQARILDGSTVFWWQQSAGGKRKCCPICIFGLP